jgi:hypothetical protein
MSPGTTQVITPKSSVRSSPNAARDYETEHLPPPFELPESSVSQELSESALIEAVQLNKSPGLIRRLSNRASKFNSHIRPRITAVETVSTLGFLPGGRTAPDQYGNEVSINAKWTKISRNLVSPEVLEQDGKRYEV